MNKESRAIIRFGAASAGLLLFLSLCAQGQNLFESDGSGRIYEIGSGGAETVFAGGFQSPTGLAFDGQGDLFVADSTTNCIYEFTNNDGTLSTNRILFANGLNGPEGLAFDRQGDLFEADSGSGNINEFTNSGGILSTDVTIFATGVDDPWGLAFDSMSNLVVADAQNGTVYSYTPAGVQSTVASGLEVPTGLCIDPAGNLFVAESLYNDVVEVTNETPVVFASGFNGPTAIARSAAGDLFVTAQFDNDIVEISTNGAQTVFASGLDQPNDVAFQPAPEVEGVMAGGTFQVTFNLPSPYFGPIDSGVIQASTNLTAWTPLYTNTPPFVFTDELTAPCRFYRAVLGQ